MATIATRRREAAIASKKKRKTIFVVLGGIAFVVLLVFQVPKTLDLLSSDTTAAPVAPVPTTTPVPKAPPAAARLLAAPATVDPFASRKIADGDPKPGPVAVPSGARDPFVRVATSTVLSPKRIVIGTPTFGETPTVGYIVVLASVRSGAGRGVAERIANRARRDGLGTVGVLDSSTRRPLRAGYYVAYVGPFTSGAAVRDAASRAHANGYRTAYIRELVKY